MYELLKFNIFMFNIVFLNSLGPNFRYLHNILINCLNFSLQAETSHFLDFTGHIAALHQLHQGT